MAISPMKKITISSDIDYLDDILAFIQTQAQLELIDLNEDNDRDKKHIDTDKLNKLRRRQEEIEHAINQLQEFVPEPSMLAKLKNGLPKITTNQIRQKAKSFDEETILAQIDEKIQRRYYLEELIEDLDSQYHELFKWRNLKVTPNELNSFSYVNAVIGLVPRSDEDDQFMSLIKRREDLDVEIVFTDELDSGVIVYCKDPDNTDLVSDLKTSQFVPFDYKYDQLPKDRLEELSQAIQEAKKEYEEISIELKQSGELINELKIQYEYVNNKLIQEAAKSNISFSKNKTTFSILAWIEECNVEDFLSKLDQSFEGRVHVEVIDLTEKDEKKAPTKLVNKKYVRPFESLVNMYGTPSYGEIDPTPYVMPFFSLFFGMMFADIGYGLLIMIVTLIPLKKFDLDESTKDSLRLANILSWSSTLWGLIYGSFFGFTIESIQLIDIQTQTMEVMVLSVAIGLVHMLIAFGINIYLQTKRKKYALAYAEGLSWFLIIVGLIMLVIGNLVDGWGVLSTIGGWMAGICLVGIFIAYCINSRSISGLGNGLLSLIDGVSYFGDAISYTRLMALGLSGASIGSAFNMIVGQLPPAARFTVGILIFIVLHGLNMFLSILTGVVHSMRLIFVEFFGKFYEGQGRTFKPLQMEEKYTRIVSDKVTEVEK